MITSEQFRSGIVDLDVPRGRLAFWWLGQHSWIIKTGNFILGLDVYLKEDPRRLVPPVLRGEDCDFFDFMFCTHEHGDHFDRPTLTVIAKVAAKTRFVVPKALRVQANEIGLPRERTILLDGQSEYEENNLRIISIPSAHEFLEFDPETGHRFLGYVINVDGFWIYHSGDTCYYDGLLAKLKQYPIDIAFVPINGRDGRRYRANCMGNLTYQEAVDLVGMSGPELTCPAHYDMFAHNSEDPHLFADYLTAKFPDQKFWIGKAHELVWADKSD